MVHAETIVIYQTEPLNERINLNQKYIIFLIKINFIIKNISLILY